MLATRLTRKRLLLVVTTSETKIAERIYNQQSWLANRIARGTVPVLETLGRRLCHRMIVYSPNLIKELRLEKYSHKTSIAHEHFLDFSKFRVDKPLNERENLVGYIARLSREKGTLNFMEAIPKVVETRHETTFLIGGDGPLRPQVEEYVNKSSNKLKFVGWIPHDKLPSYLNELRLLVVPSYTETGPYIAFEAMACGTPILATPVGTMPDVIKDGETGFVMENNSPECIAKNIVRALNDPSLEQVARNARNLVEREFTFEKAVDSYKRILETLKLKT
jgi:glycosyltransferase involved in cell wall biosynthesis